MDQWVRDIAKEAATEAVAEYRRNRFNDCPFVQNEKRINEYQEKLDRLTVRFWILVAVLSTGGGMLGNVLTHFLKIGI